MANITIIEDNAGSFYSVRDAGPGLEHVYIGIPVKRTAAGFVPKAGARERLVRRLLTRVVQEG